MRSGRLGVVIRIRVIQHGSIGIIAPLHLYDIFVVLTLQLHFLVFMHHIQLKLIVLLILVAGVDDGTRWHQFRIITHFYFHPLARLQVTFLFLEPLTVRGNEVFDFQ